MQAVTYLHAVSNLAYLQEPSGLPEGSCRYARCSHGALHQVWVIKADVILASIQIGIRQATASVKVCPDYFGNSWYCHASAHIRMYVMKNHQLHLGQTQARKCAHGLQQEGSKESKKVSQRFDSCGW